MPDNPVIEPNKHPGTNDPVRPGEVDDADTTQEFLDRNIYYRDIKEMIDIERNDSADSFAGLYHSAGIFSRTEVDVFHNRYRFGLATMHNTVSHCREYLFFTKPDLNIYPRDPYTGVPRNTLSDYLQTQPYWVDMAQNYLNVIKCLQSSLAYDSDPFNHLLENRVTSNLEIPGINATTIDTPSNMYGVGYTYVGSSEASDDNVEFSLEFKDTKSKEVYEFFRAYQDYQTIKHHGQLPPWIQYTRDKVLYDQFGIFKFLVDNDDGETILTCFQLYGVKPLSVPREAFSTNVFDQGLMYSVNFSGAFLDDKPTVIQNFNAISKDYYLAQPYQIGIYNNVADRIDGRAVKAAYVVREYSQRRGRYIDKLKWRGDALY